MSESISLDSKFPGTCIREPLSFRDALPARRRLLRRRRRRTDRKLFLGEGCSSLFVHCTQVLHLAEHSASNRIEAARATARWPGMLDCIADGSITLSTLRLLIPHLNDGNVEALLGSAKHQSKRMVEQRVAVVEFLEHSLIGRAPPYSTSKPNYLLIS